MTCSRCLRPMLRGGKKGGRRTPKRRIPPPPGHVWHEAHGRCVGCCSAIRAGRAAPAGYHRREHVIEDTAELASLGLYGEEIAQRLGISWDAVRLAHRRAGAPVPVAKNKHTVKFVSRQAA